MLWCVLSTRVLVLRICAAPQLWASSIVASAPLIEGLALDVAPVVLSANSRIYASFPLIIARPSSQPLPDPWLTFCQMTPSTLSTGRVGLLVFQVLRNAAS